jgi:hypothetical protein
MAADPTPPPAEGESGHSVMVAAASKATAANAEIIRRFMGTSCGSTPQKNLRH